MFNIYHFGDSYSDPGNIPLILSLNNRSPLINKSFDIPLADTDVTLNFRVNSNLINCDGNTFPLFLSENLNMEFVKGYNDENTTSMDNTKGKYINFAISGAGQKRNTGTKSTIGSFQYEIDKFSELVENDIIKVSDDDIFIYHDVGGNDLIQIIFSLVFEDVEPINM